MNDYEKFLLTKTKKTIETGFEINKSELNNLLFDFQKDIVCWALKKGKSAIFADCGLGKGIMSLEFAKQILKKYNKPILIIAPLAVSRQFKKEAEKIGYQINITAEQSEIITGINITNYEKIEKFNLNSFIGLIFDESSIIKNKTGHYRNYLIENTNNVKYKLCCTASPAPNDYMELGNHAELLQICKYTEMLSEFFIHDGGDTQKWRLKKACQNLFWEWIAQWAIVMQNPKDFGYEKPSFELPKLNYIEHIISLQNKPVETLFHLNASGLQERQKARKDSIKERTNAAAELVNNMNDICLVWCGLNEESEMLKSKIKNSVEIKGSDSDNHKENSMLDFAENKIKALITKSKISGFGMNWQNCHNMVFVGLSDSFEQLYQSIRRCWRFGQNKEVNVHIIVSETEGSVLANIKRKEKDFNYMIKNMANKTLNFNKQNLKKEVIEMDIYNPKKIKKENYTLINGDSCVELKNLEENSVDFSIFSPPFAELYQYSNSNRDLGNCKNYHEFFIQFQFIAEELHRIIKTGRLCTVHCIDIPAMKERDGYIGLKDFPGDIIKLFEKVGFIYHSRHTIWKDPLIEATRTKAIGLMHKQVMKDTAMTRAGLPDYLLTFRKKGDNLEFIKKEEGFTEYFGINEPKIDKSKIEYSHNVFRAYASPIWFDIRQTYTLNRGTKDNESEKHICPLQLDTIARCIQMWTNPNDLVLTPFLGVGSEIYQAIKMSRRGIGIELKESYFNQAVKNLESLEKEEKEKDLQPELF